MRLYHSPASPYVRKVMVVIKECGLEAQVDLIGATGTALDPGTMPVDQNPLGKLPTLVTDQGQAIYDSRVICRYLDDMTGRELYPQARLWDVLTLEAMADGMMDAALLMVYEARIRPEGLRYAPWVEGQWAKVTRALDLAETRSFGALDMGQIALACALGYLDFRHAVRDWRQGRPRLAAWEAQMVERPAMQTTRPPT